MNLIDRLSGKNVSAQNIRLQLKEIERDQIRKRRDLDILTQTKQEKVRQAIEAKKSGRQEVLREIFREMRQAEIEIGNANTDLRRLSLAKTALTSFLRRVQTLESRKDRKSLQNLIVRLKDGAIQKAIDTAQVDDETFSDRLEEILGEEEISVTERGTKEDAGFAEFDRAIGEMAKAEEAGAGDEDISRLPDAAESPAIKSPDNYPSYGDKPAAMSPEPLIENPRAKSALSAMETSEDCPACHGEGGYNEECTCNNGYLPGVCEACNGTGKIDCRLCDATGFGKDNCPNCYGTGCTSCSNTGKAPCDCCKGTKKQACEMCIWVAPPCNVPCPECKTKGSIWKKCGSCGGTGKQPNVA